MVKKLDDIEFTIKGEELAARLTDLLGEYPPLPCIEALMAALGSYVLFHTESKEEAVKQLQLIFAVMLRKTQNMDMKVFWQRQKETQPNAAHTKRKRRPDRMGA